MNLYGQITVDQMVSLVNLVSPTAGIRNVNMMYGAVTQTTEAEPPDVHPVSVARLYMQCDVSMAVIEDITHHMNVHFLDLDVSDKHIYTFFLMLY